MTETASAVTADADMRSDGVARDRDGRDFEAFFEQEHARLYSALWLLARDRHQAEEVMQDAFLAVWERWDRISRGPDPVGYLYRTAINQWRSRARRAALVLRKVTHQIAPREETAAVDDRDAVLRALRPLPPRQRAAIVLVDVLDLTSDQAGAILRISPSTVRVLAARARTRLAKEMGERDE